MNAKEKAKALLKDCNGAHCRNALPESNEQGLTGNYFCFLQTFSDLDIRTFPANYLCPSFSGKDIGPDDCLNMAFTAGR